MENLKSIASAFSLAFAALLVTTVVTGAAIIQTNSFFANPDVTIGFDEAGLPSNTEVNNQYAGLGVTFSAGLYQSIDDMGANSSHGDDENLSNFLIGGPAATPFSIRFQNVVTAAAFAFITNPGNSTFTTLLNGIGQESAVLATDFGVNNPNDIYQFTGLFDEITVDVGGNFSVMFMDNLQYVEAPEPASLAIVVLGLAGLALARRRNGA